MAIQFRQMPATRRTPGSYVELNTTDTPRGLAARPIDVLFIGQRLSTGTVAEKVLKQVLSADDGRTYFGRGSMLARMLDAAFAANPYLSAYAVALDDNGAATAATFEVTYTNAATGDGTASVWIAGERVDVPYSSGDAVADIATAVAAAITTALTPDLPVTAGAALGVVTLTARNKGTQGSDIDVYAEVTDETGVTVASAAAVSGATDPDLQDAIDVVVNEDFAFIVSGLSDNTNLNLLEAHLDNLVHPLASLGAIGVYAYSGAYADAATKADEFNSCGYMVGSWMLNTPTWDPEHAALMGAVLASQSDPALPYNDLEVGLVLPRASADYPTDTEKETALLNGVCALYVGSGNAVRISRAITTMTQNDAGAADDVMLDVTTPRTLFEVRYQVRTMMQTKYARAKNTQARRDALRQDILAVLFDMESLEQLENVEDNAEGVLVEVNGSDPTRNDVVIPADIVDGMHVIANRIDLTR